MCSGCLWVYLPCWVQERVLQKSPGLRLLPSGGELFPWRILMPHLHLGILQGNRSPALQSNRPILPGGNLFLHVTCKLFVLISWNLSNVSKGKMCWIGTKPVSAAGRPWVSSRIRLSLWMLSSTHPSCVRGTKPTPESSCILNGQSSVTVWGAVVVKRGSWAKGMSSEKLYHVSITLTNCRCDDYFHQQCHIK